MASQNHPAPSPPLPPSTLPPPITLRPPSTSPSPLTPFTPPPLAWLTTRWTVTHSTLPMWKKARNVRITYTALPSSTGVTHLDDTVTYQAVSRAKTKVSTVRGVDKPSDTTNSTTNPSTTNPNTTNPNTTNPSTTNPSTTPPSTASPQPQPPPAALASGSYTWRGRGWLMIATSHWEILGWGDEPDTGNSWVVTYFAKTLFTPAGVDVYARRGVLRPDTVAGIQRALGELGGEVARLAGGMFEVAFDGEGEGEA